MKGPIIMRTDNEYDPIRKSCSSHNLPNTVTGLVRIIPWSA